MKKIFEVMFLPRFNEYGFDPDQIDFNNRRDRSVPENENYYSKNNNDFDLSQSDSNSQNDLRPPYKPQGFEPRGYTDIQNYANEYSKSQPYEQIDFDRFSSKQTPRNAQPFEQRNSKVVPKEKKHKKRKSPLGKKSPLAIALVIIILVFGGIFALANSTLNKINYDEKKESAVEQSGLVNDSKITNILLLGVDARSNDKAEASRADTMMLVSIDKKHHCIKLTSFLRDTWVYIPAHNGKQRLNAACTYGGYQGVVDTIEYNFGIEIEGYVVADFEMFKVLVDSIGGVEVDVTEKEAKEVTNHKKRYGNVKLEPGKQILNGEQALAYCRIRKIDTDWQRTKRQRTVIQSIIKSAKSGNPFKLYKMINNSAPYLQTNISKSKLLSIGVKALSCLGNDMTEAKVPFDNTWQYSNIGGASVITIDVDSNKAMLEDYIYNKSADEINAENEKD